MRLAFVLITLFATEAVFAHHGPGQFGGGDPVEITGKITRVRLVNPHGYIYLDVTNANGEVEPWRCELQAGSLLKRAGWSADLFPIGGEITIQGSKGRNEPTACLFTTATLADGSKLDRYGQRREDVDTVVGSKDRMVNGKLDLNGTWAAPQRALAAGGGPGMGAAMGPGGMGAAPGGMAPGGMGPAGAPGGITLTAAGQAAIEGLGAEDNPRFHCQATSIFFDWEFDRHVNEIIQTDDTITLKYGLMDIVRTIHLGLDEHPDNITPSRAGHSIGRWEDDTLVVETIGFEEGWLRAGRGGTVLHSAELSAVERFTYDAETQGLTRTYTAEDPLYFDGTYSGDDVVFPSNTPFEAYDCVELKDDYIDLEASSVDEADAAPAAEPEETPWWKFWD